MLDGAARGEGAGDGEEHHFLVGPFFGGVVGDGDPARGDGRAFGGVGDVAGWVHE